MFTIRKVALEENTVNDDAMNRYVAALKHGDGLRDDFIYYMSFDDYKNFPDPFPRTTFTCKGFAAEGDFTGG